MRASSRSPDLTHRPPESISQGTDDGSAHFTPSDDDSDDGIPMVEGPDAYELQPIASDDQIHGNAGQSRRFSASSAQSFELYTPDEDREVRRKLDRRLVAFMALLYCLSFLDRSNIGNARIAGLEKDLKLGLREYEWLLRAFYITYIVFEWMTLMYKIVPPHIYISICVFSWGIFASLQSVTTSFGSLLVLRALLGVSEAAFGPGVPFYLSFFFRRNELALRTGLFISASPLSSSFAGALAWLITKVGENGPLSPWRLLFLLEGFPSIIIAVWAWDFIPDSPGTAKWLTNRQREVAVLRLRQEKEAAELEQSSEKYPIQGTSPRGINVKEIIQTLKDPKCYLTAFMFFSCNVAFSSMPVFLPTIIKDMGHSSMNAQALSAPPYLFAFVIVVITAYLSDLHQSRSLYIILHSLLASLGYITIAVAGYYQIPNNTIRYIALYPACAGFFSAITIIITWTINNQDSDSKKGTGMAIMNIVGQCGPLVGTSIFPKDEGPWYVKGMTICAVFMLLVGVLAMILRFVLKRQNNNIRDKAGDYAGVPVEEDGQRSKSSSDARERPDPAMGPPGIAESPTSIAADIAKEENERSSTDLRSPQATVVNEIPTNDFKPESDVEQVPSMPRGETEEIELKGEEEDPPIPESFKRSSSPAALQKTKAAAYEKVGEEGINRMHKFSLYETSTRFYLVGADIMDQHYRVLKIDRTAPPGHLNIFEDDIVYDKREMNQLLNAIDDGNKATGGLKLKCSTWGLLGFIRFTEAYYMLLITKRAQVAMLGGHYIYQVDGTELIPLTTGSTSRFQKDRNPEEARFLGILNNLDLTRSFYFSYAYNITRSLQQNIIRERTALNEGMHRPPPDYQDMFAWNHYLLEPASTALKNMYDWCHPIIHGYIDQSSLNVYGRRVFITIIARRSRFFAGARFLKRGSNDLGYVANDVETEQIVSESLNTSFHAPGPRLYANPTYTSYVQHRGSIPLYWTQDNTGVTPKPDIDLNLIDPFYSAAALHFDNLFERYGTPVYVLNLIKARERTPRESKLLYEYQHAINYLNQSLPADKKIIYEAFDMARASKTRGQDVIGTLEHLGEKVLTTTGFFHNGDHDTGSAQVQNGVARTNCIDCLDRTNAAQFVIGKRALGRQLQALGVIKGNTVEYDSDCVDCFTHMFHGHGDAIAIQYGGSHLVNTMATYRKINHWQSSSRDMVESFKRYYHNSFLDSQRQEAYNLFLGNYVFAQDEPMLWDLTTDYYLHHESPRVWLGKARRDYINWYTPSHLEPRSLPTSTVPCKKQLQLTQKGVSLYDDYWYEYYRPLALSSFLKIFAFRINNQSDMTRQQGIDKLHADKHVAFHTQDLSPFIIRKKQHDQESPRKEGKKPLRKGVTIVDPSSDTDARRQSYLARRRKEQYPTIPELITSPVRGSILRDPHFETDMPTSAPPFLGTFPPLSNSESTSFSQSRNPKLADKSLINQWTLAQFYEHSLDPTVTSAEEAEYSRYVEHPLNLPLVVSSETPSTDDPGALEFYEYLCMDEEGVKPVSSLDDHVSISDAAQVPLPSLYDSALLDTASVRSLPFAQNQAHNNYAARPTSSLSLSTPFSHHPPLPPDPVPAATANLSTPKFQTSEEDIEEFEEFLTVLDNPLDVLEEDGTKKRYKAYRQWLKGKSFFKQSKVDPEWQNQLPLR
ncbi:hypothetical protein BU24DRAFT_365769 [Aaosphaeria arxii CBS 175.79]|uniref:SAC domain-containing protein n=1 Tax=Aaosphaeria arxii CBS 175.79 TaxID=1450172 RepID=A0A6A5Y382_9PLEO|nr:uncharacterized protein BU24DRAFT_365769 [Aaosphaeria arxii CBS 175.79]KAF2019995.1 hypothetical protein BU24DRAFT_365769 [Aaosphaeria arxii CBS 175.79]